MQQIEHINKSVIFRRGLFILAGFIVVLLVIAAIWYGKVWYESRVGGARPPYLLINSTDSIRIRWGTQAKVVGAVHYGTTPEQLDNQVTESVAGKDHRVILKNLQAGTQYFYRIRNGEQWMQRGAEWFYTSPAATETSSTRVWVLGDPGYASESQSKVRDAAVTWLKARLRPGRPYLDMIMTTGDNAYKSGKNSEFDKNFFQPYRDVLKNIPVWPVFGNHDARRWSYYKIFDTPMKGESGGLPSGDRAYYSFDHLYTHFVILDSHHGDMSPGSPMLNWLAQDLQQNKKKWTVVLFHQPPYTRSTHNSDSEGDSRGRMFRVRKNILPLLEKAGVDLVFSGHSHTYERTHMMSCHYGTSESLLPWMQRRSSRASERVPALYMKPDVTHAAFSGTIYTVVGSSAKVDIGKLDHPAMAVSIRKTGSVILDMDQESLDAVFLGENGEVHDFIRLKKSDAIKPASFQNCAERQAFYRDR